MGYQERRVLYERIESNRKRPLISYVTTIRPNVRVSMSNDVLPSIIRQIEAIPSDQKEVDFLIISNGGDPIASLKIINILRERFNKISVLLPNVAYSAATVLALGADDIVMHPYSNLGPVDPQLIINSPSGPTSNPAKAIIDQFYKALKEVNEPDKQAWAILLNQYGPSIITQCENYIKMSEALVRDWLNRFMFKNESAQTKNSTINSIASFLANHDNFKSHGRHISREKAENIGLRIEHLEDDAVFQDLLLSVFHATTHTFSSTPAMKIIENQIGKAFIKIQG